MNRKLLGTSTAVLIAAMGAIAIATITKAPAVAVAGAVTGLAAVPVFLRACRGGTR